MGFLKTSRVEAIGGAARSALGTVCHRGRHWGRHLGRWAAGLGLVVAVSAGDGWARTTPYTTLVDAPGLNVTARVLGFGTDDWSVEVVVRREHADQYINVLVDTDDTGTVSSSPFKVVDRAYGASAAGGLSARQIANDAGGSIPAQQASKAQLKVNEQGYVLIIPRADLRQAHCDAGGCIYRPKLDAVPIVIQSTGRQSRQWPARPDGGRLFSKTFKVRIR